jgi:hypothetical protein
MQLADAAGKNQVGAPNVARQLAQFAKKFDAVVWHWQRSPISNARGNLHSFVSALTCDDVPQNAASLSPIDSDRRAISHRQRSVWIIVTHH